MMMKPDTVTIKGETFVLLPREEYERMIAALEDVLDARAAAQALAELERRPCPEEDLLTGEDLAEIAEVGPLRFWRKRRGMTQSALAAAVGKTQAYISDIEKGKRDGSLRVMAAIAEQLDVPLEALVPPAR
ncbi:MAG: helix-turn-helix transcriptional regulator [Methyloligellaceae bacterium]